MSRNKALNMRHRVRQELLRAANNCELMFVHMERAVEIYGDDAPDHRDRAILLTDILAALQAGITGLREDT